MQVLPAPRHCRNDNIKTRRNTMNIHCLQQVLLEEPEGGGAA
jgi:hypothetical protein